LGGLWNAVALAEKLADEESLHMEQALQRLLAPANDTSSSSSSISAAITTTKSEKKSDVRPRKPYRVEFVKEKSVRGLAGLFTASASTGLSSISSRQASTIMALAGEEVFDSGFTSSEALGGSALLSQHGLQPQVATMLKASGCFSPAMNFLSALFPQVASTTASTSISSTSSLNLSHILRRITNIFK
jgi:hypothetical protein